MCVSNRFTAAAAAVAASDWHAVNFLAAENRVMLPLPFSLSLVAVDALS
jgi:hypothetical protein